MRALSREWVEAVFKKADEAERGKLENAFRDKIVATIFYEPSTRTRMSFQTAALRLGTKLVDFGSTSQTSVVKGETLKDTIKMVDGYADAIVLRHPLEGSARLAADLASHPVINAGDGGNQHPSQTLLDLYTIRKIKKKLAGLSVYLVGDLKHGRVMRSLLYGLGMFGASATLIAPDGLEMDKAFVEEAQGNFGMKITETSSLDLTGADVVYVCRIQKERFTDQLEAQRLQKLFRITLENIRGCKPDMCILHALPRVDEIDDAIDETPHAKYFDQAKNGVPVRMAVLAEMLSLKR